MMMTTMMPMMMTMIMKINMIIVMVKMNMMTMTMSGRQWSPPNRNTAQNSHRQILQNTNTYKKQITNIKKHKYVKNADSTRQISQNTNRYKMQIFKHVNISKQK